MKRWLDTKLHQVPPKDISVVLNVFVQHCVYDIPMKERLPVNHGPTLHRCT